MQLMTFSCKLIFYFLREFDSNNKIMKNVPARKQLTYRQYADRMHLLSQIKRKLISSKQKNYCDFIPDILQSSGLPVIHSPLKKKNK